MLKNKNINSKIIIACDFDSRADLQKFLQRMGNCKLFLKLGMEIIYSCGFEIINELKMMGHQIFLDLKLHDIPTTVFKALSAIKNYDIDIVNVHSLGGKIMMNKSAIAMNDSKIILAAVTILTSLSNDDIRDIGLSQNVEESIKKLMLLTKEAGIDWVVCSPNEINIAKEVGLHTITPGIRIADCEDDQKRISTPENAINSGTDFIVIGRPITLSENPLQTYKEIQKRIGEI